MALSERTQQVLRYEQGYRTIDFRYELLNYEEKLIRILPNVESASISFQALSTIKRTATFRIREVPEIPINYLNQRIRIIMRVKVDETWQEFPLGNFLLSSPVKNEVGESVFRDVEAYDSTIILVEDKLIDRYTILRGTRYIDAVITLLSDSGITRHKLERTEHRLERDLEYEPGTSKIEVIQDLLSAVNFTPLYVDEHGFFTAVPYVHPNDRLINHQYRDNQFSILFNGVSEELDIYSIPNRWVVMYRNVDGENTTHLTSTYTNDSEESPTSTVNRKRVIVDFREINEIASQQELDAYVRRIAQQSSQLYGKVTFQTAIMPTHSYNDVILLQNQTLGIQGRYVETAWSFPCEPGGIMTHEARKVVTI